MAILLLCAHSCAFDPLPGDCDGVCSSQADCMNCIDSCETYIKDRADLPSILDNIAKRQPITDPNIDPDAVKNLEACWCTACCNYKYPGDASHPCIFPCPCIPEEAPPTSYYGGGSGEPPPLNVSINEIIKVVNFNVCLMLNIIWLVAASIAALMIILAGAKYLTADDPVDRNRARSRIIYAFTGLVLVFIACPLVDYLVENTDILPTKQTCKCYEIMKIPPRPTTTTSTTRIRPTTTSSTTTTTTTTAPRGCAIPSDVLLDVVCGNGICDVKTSDREAPFSENEPYSPCCCERDCPGIECKFECIDPIFKQPSLPFTCGDGSCVKTEPSQGYIWMDEDNPNGPCCCEKDCPGVKCGGSTTTSSSTTTTTIGPPGTTTTSTTSTTTSSVSCVPLYEPQKWNNDQRALMCNNCYNYACDKRTDNFAQPGYASTGSGPTLTCSGVVQKAQSDGLDYLGATDKACTGCTHKVALVVAPAQDFHWYRQDRNNMWSHKPGQTPAKDTDESGNKISSPETANRGIYTSFCGYFCVDKKVVSIAGPNQC